MAPKIWLPRRDLNPDLDLRRVPRYLLRHEAVELAGGSAPPSARYKGAGLLLT